MRLRTAWLRLATMLVVFPAPVAWSADPYPARPVRLIVPFAPGGATDILARALSAKLGEQLGQPFLVENRPGAAGNIGTEAVARAAPDGHTLLMGFDGTFGINPHVYARLPFDVLKDFSPITKVADVPVLVVAHAALPLAGLGDLKALAARRGTPLTFSSAGQGSTGHLAGLLLHERLGVPMTHVPYKGGGQALADVISGQVDLLLAAIPAAQPHVKSGKLKALAVTSARRSSAMPAVPAAAEAGLDGVDVSSWYGLLAPAGTPRPVIERVHGETVKALRQADLRERLAAIGAEAVGNTPQEFASAIRSDLARWAPVVRQAGVRVE